ncbi:Gfo/Idh/MocA family protein [Bryobacter aggregatus]|uniref:Gfo/Idh/MocA family protein n=1 Tax=Bryobacter aggregatus TaxID=360054 RepID=UPI0004E28741|nr:Gfo/Idh/MocA family oxidoreductase [Bryobacter aggregatus]
MQTSRRSFLLSAAALAPQRAFSANDKIRFALIGAGGMGSGDANSALAVGGSEIVAVSDIYDGRLQRAKERWGKHLFATRDYREVLARKDVDSVIVGTPDHWHAQIAIDAMEAGKDVYVEKPMVQKAADGLRVWQTQQKTGRILQVGSQRVSSIVYQKAQELLKSGAIGELNMVEAWWDRNSANGAWQYSIPPDANPANIDWDRFLGSAPKRPFEPMRLFRWRNYQDYGTGVAGDLFVHLFSGMHFITGAIGPERIYATGGLRFWKDGRDVPDVMLGLYDYPKTDAHPAFNLSLRVNFVSGAGESSGFRFVGSEGIMTVGNGVTVTKQPRESEPGYNIDTFTEATQKEFLKKYREQYPKQEAKADSMRPNGEERYLPPPRYSDHQNHHANFLASVRSRKPVVEDALFGIRAAGPALMSNVSVFEKRQVQWDPIAAKVKA